MEQNRRPQHRLHRPLTFGEGREREEVRAVARVNARYGSGEEYDGVPEPKRCNCRVCLYFGQDFEVENDSDEDESVVAGS